MVDPALTAFDLFAEDGTRNAAINTRQAGQNPDHAPSSVATAKLAAGAPCSPQIQATQEHGAGDHEQRRPKHSYRE